MSNGIEIIYTLDICLTIIHPMDNSNLMSIGHIYVHWIQWTTQISIGHMHVQWTIGHTPFAISQACYLHGIDANPMSSFKAPFTLHSIFGTAQIKLVPVPLFWFLDYLYFEPCLHYPRFLVPYHFFGSWTT
jgi:hypothetical protein